MLQMFLLYTSLLLFQLLVEIYCQVSPYTSARFLHTATLIDNKLYILGGYNGTNLTNGFLTNDFFYLDVSIQFNTQSLSWKDLSSINIVPEHYLATSVKGGANNNTLFLYGGLSNTTMALVYTFDPRTNLWSIPNITGNIPDRKFDLTGIIDYNGRMYLWGGIDMVTGNYTNGMLILDTINLSLSNGNINGAPIPSGGYSATLLPDNRIIYMGK